MVEPSGEVLTLQVLADVDDDAESLEELTARLREELLELDVERVDPLVEDHAPDDAKGAVAVISGWLAVHLGPAALKAVVNAVVAWAGRNARSVELTLNGNTLKVSGVSADAQARIV